MLTSKYSPKLALTIVAHISQSIGRSKLPMIILVFAERDLTKFSIIVMEKDEPNKARIHSEPFPIRLSSLQSRKGEKKPHPPPGQAPGGLPTRPHCLTRFPVRQQVAAKSIVTLRVRL